MEGLCPVCGGDYELDKDGQLKPHHRLVDPLSVLSQARSLALHRTVPCEGRKPSQTWGK